MDDEAEYMAIGRQVGMFIRMSDRLFGAHKPGDAGRGLDRPAFMLLGRIAVDGPFRPSALAGEVCLDLSTVSRQVAALEAAGLIRRAPDPTDRRASLVEVTPTGRGVFEENRERWLALWGELLADWKPEERRIFAALFTQLNQAIAERLPGAGSGSGPSAERKAR